jgi:hypothetical protein
MTIRRRNILRRILFVIVILAVTGTWIGHRSKDFAFIVKEAGSWCAGQ